MTSTQIPYQVYNMQAICKNPHIKYGFLRGQGGSGKTYVLSQFIKQSRIPHFKYMFLGPTGKSISVAEDKGLVGSTIHRFFMIQNNDTKVKLDNFINHKFKSMKNYYVEIRKKLVDIKYIFIDEVSMVNEDLLFHVLKTIEHSGRKDIKVFLSGDYHQLASIQNETTTASPSLEMVENMIIERGMGIVDFNTRYRSDNEDFNEFLFDLRAGKIHDSQTIANYLKHYCNIHKSGVPEEIEPKITFLEFVNDKVRDTNDILMDKLEGKEYSFSMKILKAEFPTNDTYLKDRIINDFQMDAEVKFKVGSKILFRVNNMDGQFKNGDEGIVESVKRDSVIVRKFLPSGQESLIEVKKHTYRTGPLEEKEGISIEVEQYPFSLGNSRTIHKAQGDGFKYLHLNFEFFNFNNITSQYKWQLFYVCLSRIEDPSSVWIPEDSIRILENQWSLFKSINHHRLSLNFESDDMEPETYLRRVDV